MKRISAGHLVSGGSGTGRGYGKFGFFKFAKGAASIITTSGVPPHPRICMACLTANTPAAIRADASIKPTRSLPPLNAGQSWVDVPPLHHRHLHPWPPSSSNHLPPRAAPGCWTSARHGDNVQHFLFMGLQVCNSEVQGTQCVLLVWFPAHPPKNYFRIAPLRTEHRPRAPWASA